MALGHSVFLLDHSLHRLHSPSKLFIRRLKMTGLFYILLQLLFCTRIACFDATLPAARVLVKNEGDLVHPRSPDGPLKDISQESELITLPEPNASPAYLQEANPELKTRIEENSNRITSNELDHNQLHRASRPTPFHIESDKAQGSNTQPKKHSDQRNLGPPETSSANVNIGQRMGVQRSPADFTPSRGTDTITPNYSGQPSHLERQDFLPLPDQQLPWHGNTYHNPPIWLNDGTIATFPLPPGYLMPYHAQQIPPDYPVTYLPRLISPDYQVAYPAQPNAVVLGVPPNIYAADPARYHALWHTQLYHKGQIAQFSPATSQATWPAHLVLYNRGPQHHSPATVQTMWDARPHGNYLQRDSPHLSTNWNGPTVDQGPLQSAPRENRRKHATTLKAETSQQRHPRFRGVEIGTPNDLQKSKMNENQKLNAGGYQSRSAEMMRKENTPSRSGTFPNDAPQPETFNDKSPTIQNDLDRSKGLSRNLANLNTDVKEERVSAEKNFEAPHTYEEKKTDQDNEKSPVSEVVLDAPRQNFDKPASPQSSVPELDRAELLGHRGETGIIGEKVAKANDVTRTQPSLHDTSTELKTSVKGTGDSQVDEEIAGTENRGSKSTISPPPHSNSGLDGSDSEATQAVEAMKSGMDTSVSPPNTIETPPVFLRRKKSNKKPLAGSTSAVEKDDSQEEVAENMRLARTKLQETLQQEASAITEPGEASHLHRHSVSETVGELDPELLKVETGKSIDMEDKGASVKSARRTSRRRKKQKKKGPQAVDDGLIPRKKKTQLDSSVQAQNPTEQILFKILQMDDPQESLTLKLTDEDFEKIFMWQVQAIKNPEWALRNSEWSDAAEKFTQTFAKPREGARRIAVLSSLYAEMSVLRRWKDQEAARLGQPVDDAGNILSNAARNFAVALRVQEKWPVFRDAKVKDWEQASRMLRDLSDKDKTDLENFFSRKLFHERVLVFCMMANFKKFLQFIREKSLKDLKQGGGNAAVLLHIGGLLVLSSPLVKWTKLDSSEIEFKVKALRMAMMGKLIFSLQDDRSWVVDEVSWFSSPTRDFIRRSAFSGRFHWHLKELAEIANSKFPPKTLKEWLSPSDRNEVWMEENISSGEALLSAHFSISLEALGMLKSLIKAQENIDTGASKVSNVIYWPNAVMDPRSTKLKDKVEQFKQYFRFQGIALKGTT